MVNLFTRHFSPDYRTTGLVGLLLALGGAAQAQSVGVGTTAPNAKAALEIAATDKGLLIPRLDSVARVAISSPPQGLLVYQKDGRAGLWYFQGSWQFLKAGNQADNLGNHTATQNLNLNGRLLTGGGATGLGISSAGAVGIGGLAAPGSNRLVMADAAGTLISGSLDPTTFAYTGAPQTYTVPPGVKALLLTAQGAGGGGNVRYLAEDSFSGVRFLSQGEPQPGGRGAVLTMRVPVTPGEVLTLVVGGRGASVPNNTTPPTANTGGYNGGGTGGGFLYAGGGGGGGATDIRRIPGATAANPLAGGTLASTLGQRVLVAAGGGGASVVFDVSPAEGGAAGVAGASANVPTPNGQGLITGGGAGGSAGGAGGVAQDGGLSPSPAFNGAAGGLGTGGNGADTNGRALYAPPTGSPSDFTPVSYCGGGGGGGGYFGGGGGAAFFTNHSLYDLAGNRGTAGGGGANWVGPGVSDVQSRLADNVADGLITLQPLLDLPVDIASIPNLQPALTALWQTDNTNVWRTTGNVGIGLNTPGARLHVAGNTVMQGSGGLTVSSTNPGTGTADWIAVNVGALSTGSRVVSGLLNGVATLGGHNNNMTGWANLALNPGGGNVGIGTSTPSEKLHVAGTARIEGLSGDRVRLVTADASGRLSTTANLDELKTSTFVPGSTPAPTAYVVPAGVHTLRVQARGGSGQDFLGLIGFPNLPRRGGAPDSVVALLPVTPGEVLTLVVGGGGANYGYNGGSGLVIPVSQLRDEPGGYGGGATDLRRIPGATVANPLAGGTLISTLGWRLLVAGGGGGAGFTADGGAAGEAGATGPAVYVGGPSRGGGGGGTQTAGGAGGTGELIGGSGTLGQGGAPATRYIGTTVVSRGAGGGGGYYGGGGSGSSETFRISAGGGGGGSSWTTPAATPLYRATAARRGDGALALLPVEAPLLDTRNFINSGGGRDSLGIGTTTPAQLLEVAGSAASFAAPDTRPLVRLSRPGTPFAKFPNLAEISLGSYAAGSNSLSQLDFNLGNGAVGAPDVNVLTLRGDGRVGIGTATPTEKLHVVGNTLVSGSLAAGSATVAGVGGLRVSSTNPGSGATDWIASNVGGSTGNRVVSGLLDGVATLGGHNNTLTAWAPLALNPGGGHVGIGTNNPAVPLDVQGTASLGSLTYSYLNYGFVGHNFTMVANNVSIRAAGRVVAAEFNATSDRRLKEIVGLSDRATDLALLNRLRITDYTMRDRVRFGERRFKKVIAQEVEAVFPQAVSQHTGFLPDVYAVAQRAEAEGDSVLRLTLPAALPAAKAGQRVKLIGPAGELVGTVAPAPAGPVLRVRGAAGQVAALAGQPVFVFGLEHADVRAVDYEALAMLNVSATQELARQVAALQAQNATLRAQTERAEAATTSFEARLRALEAGGGTQARK